MYFAPTTPGTGVRDRIIGNSVRKYMDMGHGDMGTWGPDQRGKLALGKLARWHMAYGIVDVGKKVNVRIKGNIRIWEL